MCLENCIGHTSINIDLASLKSNVHRYRFTLKLRIAPFSGFYQQVERLITKLKSCFNPITV